MSTASEILANIKQLFSSFGINRKRRLDETTELPTTATPLGPPKYRRVNNDFPKIIEHPIHFDDENQSAYINSIKRQQKLSTRHRQDHIAYSTPNNSVNTPINKIYDNYQKQNYFSMNNRNATNSNSNNINNYINLSNEDDEDNSNGIDNNNHNVIRSPQLAPLQSTATTTTNINNENAYLLLNGNNSRTATIPPQPVKRVPSLLSPINSNNIEHFIGTSYIKHNNQDVDNINYRRSVPQLIRSKFSRIPDLKHINKIPKAQYNGFDQSGYIASGNRLLSNNINYQHNNNNNNNNQNNNSSISSSGSTNISMINGGRSSASSGIPVLTPAGSTFARPSLIPVNSRATKMVNLSLSKQSLTIPPRNSILDHNAKCDDKQAYDRLLKSLISGYDRKQVKNKEPFALYRSSDWEDDSIMGDGYISEKEEEIIEDGFQTPSQYRLNKNHLYETFDGIRQNESPVIRSYDDYNEHENENRSGHFLNQQQIQITPLQNDLFAIHKLNSDHQKSPLTTTGSNLNRSYNLIDFNSYDDDDNIENPQNFIYDNDMIKKMNVLNQSILDMSIEKLIKRLEEKKHKTVNQYLKAFETIDVSDDDDDADNTEAKSQTRQMKITQTLQGLQKQNKDLYNGISSYDNSLMTIPKVTPVNSLQDRLNNTIKFSNEWLIDFNKRYSGMKIDHKKSLSAEHEKLKQVELETAKLLHEQSIRTSRIPDTIIVLEEKEPIEIIDDFPQLTSEQLTELMRAVNGDPEKQLITKFSITICRRDLNTLNWQRQAWLNDEVINFYMNLLMERSQLIPKLPKMYAMNTFFAVRLLKDGHGGVRRWTRKVDIFAHDIIAIPVHVGNIHWCMAIINFQEKSISYYDSMGNPNQAMLNALHRYLEAESLDKKGVPYDMSGWVKESIRDSPRQENGNDCGVFACMTAEFVGRSRPISFQQKHMRYFRQKMSYEISTGKLLLP